MVAKMLGYKINLFVVGPIVCVKKSKNYKLKFSGTLMFSGCVMPQINENIYDELSFKKSVNQYIKILYGGIFATIVAIVIVFIGVMIKTKH